MVRKAYGDSKSKAEFMIVGERNSDSKVLQEISA